VILRMVSKVKNHPLLGIWEHVYSPTKWIVSISNGKLMVDGVDTSNWEKYRISHLASTNAAVTFTSHYPSTGRVVSNVCTALSKQKMKVLLSYEVTEIWTRSTPHAFSKTHPSNLDARSRQDWLVGNWHNQKGDDPRVVCTISRNNNRWYISAEDTGDAEQLRVTGVKWNGRSLSFRTMMPSTGQICHRTLKPISQNKLKVVLQIKESDVWERLGRCEQAPAK